MRRATGNMRGRGRAGSILLGFAVIGHLFAACGHKTSDDPSPSPAGIVNPTPSRLPVPSGPCPTLAEGEVVFTPRGTGPRAVRLWMSQEAAKGADGPLVFYWHGTGSTPILEPEIGLSQPLIDAIAEAGGIVAAPYSDPAAGTFEWFLTTARAGGRDDDLRVADEVLACAIQQVGIDTRHIHVLGMSAGGIQAAQMSVRRSSYVASVAVYSGGLPSYVSSPAFEDPTNLFAALLFHGGASDVVFLSFERTSEAFANLLIGTGHFVVMCDHGRGHTIPRDARTSVWRFFLEHPFGTLPSPYAGGLPASFPDYCEIAR